MEQLQSTQDLDQFIAESGPRWVMKHSAICSISHAALSEFEKGVASHAAIPAAMVVIQEHRPVSNYIAEVLGKVHQSPQLFLVNGKDVLWTATHWSITEKAMTEALSAQGL